jgi:hypothetical protein
MSIDVHEDNWRFVEVFRALQTQWRVIAGFHRVTYQGLDYAAIPAVLSMLRISSAQRAETFAAIRVMERAALPILNRSPDDD